MSKELLDRVVQATLYEGYILYPYRPSVKNRQRWTFGGLYPCAYSQAQGGSDAWEMQTECLVAGPAEARLSVTVRFLHLMARQVGRLPEPLAELPPDEVAVEVVEQLEVAGRRFYTWQEAVERRIDLGEFAVGELMQESAVRRFSFPAMREREELRDTDGRIAALLIRQQEAVAGGVEVKAEALADGLTRVRVTIRNEAAWSPEGSDRDLALMRSLASTHTILRVSGGDFVSLLDPPAEWQTAVAHCKNVGTWPVLVGEAGDRSTMLSSPIILYDYPEVAPESPGDLFDATEIDEILTLRILTLTEEEKRAMLALDGRARALLERTEALTAEQLLALHGTMRERNE